MIIKRMKLSDILTNKLLKIRYWLIKNFNKSKIKNYSPLEKKDREVFFEDDFNEKSWDDRINSTNAKWVVGAKWGEYHPESPLGYMSEPFELRDSCAVMGIRYNPKMCRKHNDWSSNPELIEIKYETSKLYTNKSYSKRYGRFECRCKMPNAYASWSAFWLSGTNSWPPEIDIFETYGGKSGLMANKAMINLHYGDKKDGTKSNMIARGIKVSNKNKFINEFHEYALEWTEDKIEIFIDGIKIFRYTRKDILDKWYNTDKGFMNTIINNGFDSLYFDMDNLDKDYYSEYLVDYVRIYKERNNR